MRLLLQQISEHCTDGVYDRQLEEAGLQALTDLGTLSVPAQSDMQLNCSAGAACHTRQKDVGICRQSCCEGSHLYTECEGLHGCLSNHLVLPRLLSSVTTLGSCQCHDKENMMSHGVQEYLAPATQDMFQAVVTEYLWLPWKHAQQQQREQGSSQVPTSAAWHKP